MLDLLLCIHLVKSFLTLKAEVSFLNFGTGKLKMEYEFHVSSLHFPAVYYCQPLIVHRLCL